MKHHYDTVNADELPIVLEHGGPTEGSKHVEIVEGECGNCEYDRIKVERQYGEVVESCMLCEYSRFGSEPWEAPTTDRDHFKRLREFADENDSPVEKVGRVGGRDFVYQWEIFDVPSGLEVFCYLETNDVEREFLFDSEMREIVALLEEHNGFLTDVVDEHVEGKAVTNDMNAPNNPNAVHVGVWEHKYADRTASIPLINTIRHDDRLMSLPPIHLDHEADGIVA
jgi:hypothetical protein